MRTEQYKQQIRRAFNAATPTYDSAADWQKSVGDVLLDYIDSIPPVDKTILDLGAGTSYLAHHLQHRYPDNTFIALDIAESMLLFSKQHLSGSWFICADAETLPFQAQSIDIIMSNMMLQWCVSLTTTLQQQYNALRPGGLLFFSVLGPQSLRTFKKAWEGIDPYSHINDFPHADAIQQACRAAGFSLLRFEQHEITKHYKNVYALMHHLKATGAKNISANKHKGLTGKEKIRQLNEQYQNPVNYEIYTAVCRK